MEKYLLIINNSISPAFNLACEEYYLTRKRGAYILLWRNSRSVIIGRNQNAYAELDFDFVRDNGIDVIRRLTGGGAVFHDPGNLNFSFIFNGTGLADFRKYLSPVADFLRSLGIDAVFSGRNDILADGRKISGCAQANIRGRTIVHGTLLYSADLSLLSGALKPNPLKLKSNGVGSVRSRVVNINELTLGKMSTEEFRDSLASYLATELDCEYGSITENDTEQISLLACEKYSAFTWNIGQSPSWSMEKTGRINSGLITFAMSVKDGVIADMKIFGDFFSLSDVGIICSALTGCVFSPDEVIRTFERICPESIIPGLTPETAAGIIFSRAQ